MSSIKCPKCNLANWVQATACKRCGGELTDAAAGFAPAPVTQPLTDPYDSYQNVVPVNALRSGLALASMIIGIVAVPTSLFLIGLLLAPISMVMGIVALVKASKKPLIYGGKGFAIAGIATSSVAFLFVLPLVAAIAIPNLLASKRAANEGSAIASLRTLFAAEATYMATAGQGSCGDLGPLAKNGLIDPTLATGLKNDFRFEVAISDGGRVCEIFATPVSTFGGTRSFTVSNDGVIRGADKKGSKADKHDPPLAN